MAIPRIKPVLRINKGVTRKESTKEKLKRVSLSIAVVSSSSSKF